MENPADILQVGQEIRPRILSIDEAAGKVGLTLLSAEQTAVRTEKAERRRDRSDRGGGSGEGGEDGGAPQRQRFEGQRREPGEGSTPRAARRQGVSGHMRTAFHPKMCDSYCFWMLLWDQQQLHVYYDCIIVINSCIGRICQS